MEDNNMEDYYGFVVDRKGISAKYSTYRGYESYIGSIVKVEIANTIKVYTKIKEINIYY